jgi:hypothetical protein
MITAPFVVALALSVSLGPAVAQTQEGRAPFQPIAAAEVSGRAKGADAGTVAGEGKPAPLILKAATVRDVDRNGDGRIGFDELLAADFRDGR